MPRFGANVKPYLKILSGAGHYLYLPVLTTTQRDALSAAAGYLIYNSTTGQAEEYTGSTWRSVGQAILTTHTAVLDAHTKNIYEVLRTGEYYTQSFGFNTTFDLVASTLYAIYFLAARNMTVDRIACEVSAQAGQKIRMGIYQNGTNLAPGALLLDAGEITLSATGIQALTINQALTKGIYFMAIVSNGAPTIKSAISYRGSIPVIGVRSSSFSNTQMGWSGAHTYAALPDPFGTPTAFYNEHLMILPRILSLD